MASPSRSGSVARKIPDAFFAADLIVFDPNYEDTINPKNFYSKSRNSTFENEKVRGKVLATLVDGRILFQKNLKID